MPSIQLEEVNTVLPMPFVGTRFFEAVQMFSDEIKLKYLRALWFYWQHTHCSGIPNDDEGLRELCVCDPDLWKKAKPLIFDNDKFFVLENGKWHQKRCRKFWENEVKKQVGRQAQTLAGRIKSGLVPRSVADDVTTPVGLMFNERALDRTERRLDDIKKQFPIEKGSKLHREYEELKTERRRIMSVLGLKA